MTIRANYITLLYLFKQNLSTSLRHQSSYLGFLLFAFSVVKVKTARLRLWTVFTTGLRLNLIYHRPQLVAVDSVSIKLGLSVANVVLGVIRLLAHSAIHLQSIRTTLILRKGFE
jgi:hypothetical protein